MTNLLIKLIIIIGIICVLAFLTTIILTFVSTFKMQGAIVRGRAIREKCGAEYYEAETVRYQVYDTWEKEVKKIFNGIGSFNNYLLIAILVLYIVIIGIQTWSHIYNPYRWIMMLLLVITLILHSTIGSFLLLPDSGIKLYGELNDSSLAYRILVPIIITLIMLAIPWITYKFKNRDSESNYINCLGETIVIIIIVAFVTIFFSIIFNLIPASMIKNGIYQNYYNPLEPTTKVTGELNELIKKNITSSNNILYKKVLQGIRDVDNPPNGVDEGSLKNPSLTTYQPYFKYLKHSKEMDTILDGLGNDYKSKFNGLEHTEESIIAPIKNMFALSITIITVLILIPAYFIFHANYQKSGFLVKIGVVILILMIFSFLYVNISQSLIS